MESLCRVVSHRPQSVLSLRTKYDVWHEENSRCDVVLVAYQTKVFVHAFDFCISNIRSINMGQKVKHCHDRYKTHVDLFFVNPDLR